MFSAFVDVLGVDGPEGLEVFGVGSVRIFAQSMEMGAGVSSWSRRSLIWAQFEFGVQSSAG